MNVSNKFLVFLLVITIILVIAGTFMSLKKIEQISSVTGYGTAGYVNLTITQLVSINITQPDCNFGSGYVTPPAAYAILASNGTNTNWTGAGTSNSIVVRNDGNVLADIQVNSTGSTIGTTWEYRYWSYNKESNACNGTLVSYPGNELYGNATKQDVCIGGLQPQDAADEIYVGCYFKIPDNASPGTYTDTWTFWATASSTGTGGTGPSTV